MVELITREGYDAHMNTQTHKKPFPRVLSCGILIESPAGWLLAHASRTPRWDIPKGKIEPGEKPVEAALRETREEIGIDLEWAREMMVDLGRHSYLPKKDLHLFHLVLDHALDLAGCVCTTYVELPDGERIPETDDYEWVPLDRVRNRIGNGLAAYMHQRGLLDAPPEPTTRREPKP